MMTEIKEMMETIAKHRNLLDTDDPAQRGTMLMGAYPELLVNLLSRFALGICHDRSVVFHDFKGSIISTRISACNMPQSI